MFYDSSFVFYSHSVSIRRVFGLSHTNASPTVAAHTFLYTCNFFRKFFPWHLLSPYVLPDFCFKIFVLKYFRKTSTLGKIFSPQIFQRKFHIPYLFDQTLLSNCGRTSGHAEWNSRRSRWYLASFPGPTQLPSTVNRWKVGQGLGMTLHNSQSIGTKTRAVQRSLSFIEARRAIIVWNHWKKTRKHIGGAV